MSEPALPHLPLDDFRRHGHDLIDWIADYLEGAGERDVLATAKPGEVRSMIPNQAPDAPESMDDILADLDEHLDDGPLHRGLDGSGSG